VVPNGYFAIPPPNALVVPAGDPRLGGVLCGNCKGTGTILSLLFFEDNCPVYVSCITVLIKVVLALEGYVSHFWVRYREHYRFHMSQIKYYGNIGTLINWDVKEIALNAQIIYISSFKTVDLEFSFLHHQCLLFHTCNSSASVKPRSFLVFANCSLKDFQYLKHFSGLPHSHTFPQIPFGWSRFASSLRYCQKGVGEAFLICDYYQGYHEIQRK
jgi:hypothetical protein